MSRPIFLTFMNDGDNGEYYSVEAAFQAAKCAPHLREAFQGADVNPKACAKKDLRKFTKIDVKKWNNSAPNIMHNLLTQKFPVGYSSSKIDFSDITYIVEGTIHDGEWGARPYVTEEQGENMTVKFSGKNLLGEALTNILLNSDRKSRSVDTNWLLEDTRKLDVDEIRRITHYGDGNNQKTSEDVRPTEFVKLSVTNPSFVKTCVFIGLPSDEDFLDFKSLPRQVYHATHELLHEDDEDMKKNAIQLAISNTTSSNIVFYSRSGSIFLKLLKDQEIEFPSGSLQRRFVVVPAKYGLMEFFGQDGRIDTTFLKEKNSFLKEKNIYILITTTDTKDNLNLSASDRQWFHDFYSKNQLRDKNIEDLGRIIETCLDQGDGERFDQIIQHLFQGKNVVSVLGVENEVSTIGHKYLQQVFHWCTMGQKKQVKMLRELLEASSRNKSKGGQMMRHSSYIRHLRVEPKIQGDIIKDIVATNMNDPKNRTILQLRRRMVLNDTYKFDVYIDGEKSKSIQDAYKKLTSGIFGQKQMNDTDRIDNMTKVVFDAYKKVTFFRNVLDATGDMYIINGNSYDDRPDGGMFWGSVLSWWTSDNGSYSHVQALGSNHLGRILMQVRDDNKGL